MKTLSEYLNEQMEITYEAVEYHERYHVALYYLNFWEQDVKDKFNDLNIGFSSDDDEFEQVAVEIAYDANELRLSTPLLDGKPGVSYHIYRTKNDLWSYRETGIKVSDFKKMIGDEGNAKQVAEFLCWFFNTRPDPEFKTLPKAARRKK